MVDLELYGTLLGFLFTVFFGGQLIFFSDMGVFAMFLII
jgi:hypothetical protein